MTIQRTTGLTPVHIVTCLLLGGFCLSPAYGQASFQGLGDLPGGFFESLANAVSADGTVVVGHSKFDFSTGALTGIGAFRWTSASGMIGLGDLPSGSFSSQANGVSTDGSVVVGRGVSASGNEAFRWTIGGMVGLGDLAGGGFFSQANATSANGLVVVGQSHRDSGFEAFRWTSADGMVGLGDLADGDFFSIAFAVSDDGSVVVGQGSSFLGDEAFRWTNSGMIALGDLAGGIFRSSALGVSADGSVVVGRGRSASGSEAFRWTSANGMVGLGDLAGGSFFSIANDVSADGSVVVGRGTGALSEEAFIWDAANGMQSLQAVLEGQLGLDLSGWTLTEAMGVSADGTTIVGWGINPNEFIEAFIAVIPGPGVCLADITGDGNVNVTDLLSLLGAWGPNLGHPADINDDGTVNVTDLLTLLGAWGACP